MAKRLSQKAKVALLEEYKEGPLPPGAPAHLEGFLKDTTALVTAEAAKIVKKYRLKEMVPHLVNAFHRLAPQPYKADIGCLAKTAIVDALDTMDYNDTEDVFYRGITLVQPEPGWGETNDTASELRARCGMALARIPHPRVFFLLVNLVADNEPQARTGAVRALAYLGTRESELLLRMKVLNGDPQPAIISECLSGLMSIEPDRSMDFTAAFLDSRDPAVIEDAAIALGESRHPRALEILREHRERAILQTDKHLFILPIALTRLDEAFQYLLEIVEQEHEDSAVRAVESLPAAGIDDQRLEQVHRAIELRPEKEIKEAFNKYFS